MKFGAGFTENSGFSEKFSRTFFIFLQKLTGRIQHSQKIKRGGMFFIGGAFKIFKRRMRLGNQQISCFLEALFRSLRFFSNTEKRIRIESARLRGRFCFKRRKVRELVEITAHTVKA